MAFEGLAKNVERAGSASVDWLAGQVAPEVSRKLAGALVAPLRLFGEALQGDRVDITIGRGRKPARRRSRHMDDVLDHVANAAAYPVRELSCKRVIEQYAQRV